MENLSIFNKEDRLKKIIANGESEVLEFKRTFALKLEAVRKNENYKEKTVKAETNQKVLKGIVAFLNAKGGTLLLGVDDNGKILGFGDELQRLHDSKLDNFRKYFKDVFDDRIGSEHFRCIKIEEINTSSDIVISIECKQSNSPCFLDGKEFYIRTPASSDQLHGKALIEYVTHILNELTSCTGKVCVKVN